jgi:hypothetical protein
MTPGDNGASTPEDDDPFGYLYADGQARGAQPPSGGYGYPNAVNRVRPVGERKYGQPQQPTAQYGQAPPQQGAYGQPNASYAAPETLPGGAPGSRRAANSGGGGRGRGPNTKGLLIGALAVVAAVVIGISVAMMNGGDKENSDAGATPSQSQSASQSASSSSGSTSQDLSKPIDAKTLKLEGGATTASDVKGAQADGGVYVSGLNQTGATVTWTVNGVPSEGAYTVFAHYSTVEDQSMTLTVNGTVFGSKMNMENYRHVKDGNFENGWTTTYAWPTLTKGTNTISVSCGDGDKCNVLLDQLWLKQGRVKD